MKYFLSIILLLALSPSLFAAEYRGDCNVTFKADSTLHEIHGTGKCQPFSASSKDDVLEVSQVTVPISSLDTGNARRDRKMREMFEDKRYPLIAAVSAPVALQEIRNAKEGGKVTFKLKMRDVVRPVTGTVANFTKNSSRITADVTFTVSLADYELKPPSVVGLIKVDDKVTVTVSVILDAK
jgi:polyisoprenoid-binding protein YceI